MRLLFVMIVLLAVVGTSMAVQLSGPAGKAILANLTGNVSLNTSTANETQNGLTGWGSPGHNLTIDSGNGTANESGILNNESAMETPTQASNQSAAT
jgi:hypothetical protein